MPPADLPAAIASSVARIHAAAPGLAPRLGLVLGSGWDGIADLVHHLSLIHISEPTRPY